MKLRRIFALFIFTFALPAIAQQYPTKPVRLLVGYAAGSSTDIVGRVMADRLGAYWKQTVIWRTAAGAAGNLAADAVAKAQGDGYTLLFAQNGPRDQRGRAANLPFQAENDLVPIAPVAATPHILIVGPDFPAKNRAGTDRAREGRAGQLTFASSGVGNSDHLCGELFQHDGGHQRDPRALQGRRTGRTGRHSGTCGVLLRRHAGRPAAFQIGKGAALGVTSSSATRPPDVPTIADRDYRVRATLWNGFFAPASILPELAARIARDVETVLKQPETARNAAEIRRIALRGQPGELQEILPRDIEKWKNLVKSTHLKLE